MLEEKVAEDILKYNNINDMALKFLEGMISFEEMEVGVLRTLYILYNLIDCEGR